MQLQKIEAQGCLERSMNPSRTLACLGALLVSSCGRGTASEGREAASEVSSAPTPQGRPAPEPEREATLLVLGRWSMPGAYSGLQQPSYVDSDADACPELVISTGLAGSHLVHGRCARGASWASAQVAGPGEWAGLVALRERGHALVEQRGAELEIFCGALSEGRWRHHAGSTVAVEHHLRPTLISSVPADSSLARASFVLLGGADSLIHLAVDDDCELRELGRARLPPMELVRADWWTPGQGHAPHLCLTGYGTIALPVLSCAPWPLAPEPKFQDLGLGGSLELDLLGVFAVGSERAELSLARLEWDPDARSPTLRDTGMGAKALPTLFAGVVLADGRVILLGGGDRSERLLARELNSDGSSRELPLPAVEGSLAGLASLRVGGRRGFALVSADDEAVYLTVLGVR
ncbi:MAG: hypothetical protein R6X02_35605 [Enhygromyxa sp.]